MAELQTLKELESLLTKLYLPKSTNDERLQIHKVIENFAQQDGVWKYCLYFLENSSNEQTLMYTLHVLESTIVHKWSVIDVSDKLTIRHFLMDFLVTKWAELPVFLRNKMVHVFVLIGQADWPHNYPQYMEHIMNLIHDANKCLLGLSLLLVTSEEFATPKTDLLSSLRRQELKTLMLQHIPHILDTLVQLLNSSLVLHHAPIKQLLGGDSPPFSLKLPPELIEQALSVLNHLFSWIPLSREITSDLIETVFKYATLGCYSNVDPTKHSGGLGSLAMDCINELLVKHCVPREFELFLMKLFDQSFILLQRLLSGEDEKGKHDFSRLDDRYLSKCGDFFFWFVSSHLKRVEFNPQFPVLEFLALFYKYTFRQPEIDSFCVCLETWSIFLDHLIMMTEDTSGDLSPHSNTYYERYKDILVNMMLSVLQKILFHYNSTELNEIDDDCIHSDNETEWQSFLRQSIEFVGKVADLFPTEAFQMILPLLEQYSQVYLSLSQVITQQGNERVLAVLEKIQCESLHAILKDLATILQTLGRLAEHFSGKQFLKRLGDAQTIVNQFSVLATFSTEQLLFNVKTPVPDVLEHDFIELHAQVLGTLQAYQHWLSELYLSTLSGQQSPDLFYYLLSSTVAAALPVISHEVPEKVALAAARLFISVSLTIRPHFLYQLPHVQHLLSQIISGQTKPLPQKISLMVHEAIVGMCVLPWPSLPDAKQNWELRYTELCRIVQGATGGYRQLLKNPQWTKDTSLHEQAKPEIKETLTLLQTLVEIVTHERKNSKTILYKSISTCTEDALPLLHIYSNDTDVLEVLMDFFYKLFQSLLPQLGLPFTDRIIQTFMTLLTREHLEKTILQEGGAGNRVVEKFINILELLVQDCTTSEKSFLPTIIEFAMKQVYPAISMKELPEVKLSLYKLLYQLLHNNWRYFYPASVLLHLDGDDPLNNKEEFLLIMEAFGNSFLQSDIEIFRYNIEALETLNSKHGLFGKAHFISDNMWQHFLRMFLQVLIQQTHSLLQEEICSCIYHMARVNLMSFHTEFLPRFLGDIEGLSESQQVLLVDQYKIVEDLPTFTQNLNQFSNDLRYYLTINSALPAHSIKLTSQQQ